MKDYLKKILTAKVYDVAKNTDLDEAPNLSKRLQNQIYLKREDLQPVFSFKIRGAYNKMASLSEDKRKNGVICASAGNHAQGVALGAKKLGCHATIVMPATTPSIKVKSVKNLGGKVVLFGDTYDEAYKHALEIAKKQGLSFIHAYDDPYVIAGQGTVGMEILQQLHDEPDYIFVPVGGGGLISGIASYVKQISPKTKVIGVEPVKAAAMHDSLKAKKRVRLDSISLFADGVAVKEVGKETFRLCQKLVDDVVLVDTDEICAAIKDVFEEVRVILEPSGALSVAGMSAYLKKKKIQNKTCVCVLSGANMNFFRLRHVSERAEIGEQREAIFAVTIPETPGSFKKLINAIGNRAITEFNYRYADPKNAHVFMGIGIEDRDEIKSIIQKLKDKGFPAVNLTNNELAILHLRHLVGGKATNAKSERFVRFDFPERKGALKDFLNAISGDWNISLFHYRNHGTDYGRVLIGLQVPQTDQKKFAESLKKVGYRFIDETENPACRLFL